MRGIGSRDTGLEPRLALIDHIHALACQQGYCPCREMSRQIDSQAVVGRLEARYFATQHVEHPATAVIDSPLYLAEYPFVGFQCL